MEKTKNKKFFSAKAVTDGLRSKKKNKKLFSSFRSLLHPTPYTLQPQAGFTLMEIVVSTTIFIVAISAMLTLFTYTLKINRKGDAMRQATQGMRNFTEFLTKEIRNGKIDYGVSPVVGLCSDTEYDSPAYALGLININGERECLWWDSSSAKALMLQKEGTNPYSINPSFFTVESLRFYVSPKTDPYVGVPPPQIHPFVTVVITFQVRFSANEAPIIIPYQTSVSTDLYDVPK